MVTAVEIPEMGESVAEVVLLEWLASDGEYVERDKPICILETDKANVDLPAPAAGVLAEEAEDEAEAKEEAPADERLACPRAWHHHERRRPGSEQPSLVHSNRAPIRSDQVEQVQTSV